MKRQGQRWSVVLAGGRGARLAGLTTVAGENIPKQYWAFGGGQSMLRRALWRAAANAAPDHILVVVTEDQRRHWQPELRDLRPDNLLVQPADRGTAAALLVALHEVLQRDPQAILTVLPADHHVELEGALAQALRSAAELVAGSGRPLALIGVEPQEADPDYGWIQPVAPGRPRAAGAVARFRDRPTRAQAAASSLQGALIFTGIFAARGQALRDLCERLLPEVALPLAAGRPLGEVYPALPSRELAGPLFEAAPESLSVLHAGDLGWSDLGTPDRVIRCLSRLAGRTEWPAPPNGLDLRLQVLAAVDAALAS